MKKKELSLRHLLVAEMPYKLLSFLIEERALTEFINNSLQNLCRPREVPQLYDREIFNIIFTSFLWNNTNEGYLFWLNLYIKCKNANS